MIKHGMLIEELVQGTDIIELLFDGNFNSLILHIVVMIEVDMEVAIGILFQYKGMDGIGIIVGMGWRRNKPKNEFAEHMTSEEK